MTRPPREDTISDSNYRIFRGGCKRKADMNYGVEKCDPAEFEVHRLMTRGITRFRSIG